MVGRFYTNPVHDASFPDPFVLRHLGEYWAYCTGMWHDGRAFGVLRSPDLVRWTEVGGAMDPLANSPPHYWAPEVTFDNGRFLLYYSAGDEETMEVRLAVAERPEGPFVDAGARLTTETFAIDPHVFVDDDGSRFMFYATDFLEHERIGTGTLVDRMLDEVTLEGRPRPVTRARHDWQIYDARRAEKGGVKWHTVEGPFVLKRKGRYYEMFSGGNWQNVSYGVSYAVSPKILADDEWAQACDGADVLPILRTVPDRAVGPGHNSVVLGPDGRQLYCVYHRWTSRGRALAIDRQEFVGDRIVIYGPSTGPVPAPIRPSLGGFSRAWDFGTGTWSVDGDRAAQESTTGVADARCNAGASAFAAEVAVRCARPEPAQGSVGLALAGEGGIVATASLRLGHHGLALRWLESPGWAARDVPLPEQFDYSAWHTFRADVDGPYVRLAFDGGAVVLEGTLAAAACEVHLLSEAVPCEFAGFWLSRGWTNDFARGGADPAAHGWRARDGAWRVEDFELRATAADAGAAVKAVPCRAYELVVNARVLDGDGTWVVAPAVTEDLRGPRVMLERSSREAALLVESGDETMRLALVGAPDPREHLQLRFVRRNAALRIALGDRDLCEIAVAPDASFVALATRGGRAAYDHVRLSELPATEETD